jgi:hypothetical protein
MDECKILTSNFDRIQIPLLRHLEGSPFEASLDLKIIIIIPVSISGKGRLINN